VVIWRCAPNLIEFWNQDKIENKIHARLQPGLNTRLKQDSGTKRGKQEKRGDRHLDSFNLDLS